MEREREEAERQRYESRWYPQPSRNTLRLACSLLSDDAVGRDASFPEASGRDDAQPEEEEEAAAPRCSVVSWVGVETVRPQPTWVDGHQASVAAEQSGAHAQAQRTLSPWRALRESCGSGLSMAAFGSERYWYLL